MGSVSTFPARLAFVFAAGAALAPGCSGAGEPPTTVMPQVVRSGGSVMAAPRVVPVVFTSDPSATDVVAFVGQLAGSAYWSDVTSQYGVGALSAAPAVRVDEAPLAGADPQEVETWLRKKLMSDPRFPQPTEQTIYALFLPGEPVTGFAGYHQDFALPNGSIATYAVMRDDSGIDNVTVTASHELAEAATDPRPSHGPA